MSYKIPIYDTSDVYHTAKVKTFPDGHQEIMAASRAIFKEPGFEEICPKNWADNRAKRKPDAQTKKETADVERSKRRARAAVREYGLCNDWQWFVTLTLDPARIERYDANEVLRTLRCWLDNAVRRHGLHYVLVPERHKKGGIHFHGFFGGSDFRAVDSGHRDKGGHVIYNLPDWTWGFSTGIELYGDLASAVGYCCKYISKGEAKVGGRWYYCGGELRKADIALCDLSVRDVLEMEGGKATSFEVQNAGLLMGIWRENEKK